VTVVVLESIALDDDDAVVSVGQYSCGEESRDAATEDDRTVSS
jgi:hypothetical protein